MLEMGLRREDGVKTAAVLHTVVFVSVVSIV